MKLVRNIPEKMKIKLLIYIPVYEIHTFIISCLSFPRVIINQSNGQLPVGC